MAKKKKLYIVVPLVLWLIYVFVFLFFFPSPEGVLVMFILAILIFGNWFYQESRFNKFEDKYLSKKLEKKYGKTKVWDIQFIILFFLLLAMTNAIWWIIDRNIQSVIGATVGIVIAGSLWIYKKYKKK